MTTIEIGTRLFIAAMVITVLAFLVAVSAVGGRAKR